MKEFSLNDRTLRVRVNAKDLRKIKRRARRAARAVIRLNRALSSVRVEAV